MDAQGVPQVGRVSLGEQVGRARERSAGGVGLATEEGELGVEDGDAAVACRHRVPVNSSRSGSDVAK